MQKSKNTTIIISIVILLYGILANAKLVKEINIIYLYIINPIFWIGISAFIYAVIKRNSENPKLKNQVIQYTIIAALIYSIVYIVSGFFVTFGKNPYSTTLKGIINNIWIFGVEIIAKEYIRYKLINNVTKKDKYKIAIIISIIYVIIDLNFAKFNGMPGLIIKYFIQDVLPIIALNITFSYTSIYGGCLPGIVYQICTHMYFWLSPIIPNAPWIMMTIIDTTIPIILFLYVRYAKSKLDIFRTKENIVNSDPKDIIPLVVMIIIAIWFAIGVFPIKPVAIATGSMENELCIGDVAIIKKCGINDINVGGIIEYKKEGYTVVHRVVEKGQKKGHFYLITKGDNNVYPDKEPVEEDKIIGKVVFKIKYIGYPAIWLHSMQTEKQTIDVETGR